MAKTFSTQIGDKEITIETGKLAGQAGGAITIRSGDTMLFCAATMSRSVREGLDFFPLTVEYEEKMYAGGRIPGGFFRREGRPTEDAILTSRVVDRTLRPLFPKQMRNEVQVILMSLSHDQEHQADMLGVIAASTALMISDVPWAGPVAGVRIGLINDELVVNPTYSEMENSRLDLRVAGTLDAINMVECGADEVDEETMIRALALAHKSIQPVLELQQQMQAELGKQKADYVEAALDETLAEEVRSRVEDEIRQIVTDHIDRHERNAALDEVRETVRAEYESRNENLPEDEQVSLKAVKESMAKVVKSVIRERIIQGIRPDGRDHVTIRALSSEVDLVPRVHGSGLFQRGETQVLTIATLGTPRDAQMLDGLNPQDDKRYMHHYNFPPYSTGETWFLRGPKRREIGHGSLAENALLPVLPPVDKFPYTIRTVSEVMSSNGSTSMASVCGSTLSLMAAGVPLKNPVAGIAMGLIKEGDEVAILTDIQGMEDHLGDMDFKVAGTQLGITALQMDIKITGVSDAVMNQALAQARDARLQILDVITAAISEPRSDLSDFAPRMISLKIDPEKIGAVIGPGGKMVRSIQETYNAKVEIEDDGTVFISGNDGPTVMGAVDKVKGLVEEAELGQIYTGKVVRIENYGAFVEFLPGKDGLVHISQLADFRVKSVSDEVSIGDEIMVMVIDIDRDGRVRLSRQAVMEGWDVEEAKRRDRSSRPSRGGGNRGGRGGNRDGGNRGRRDGGSGGNRGGRDGGSSGNSGNNV